MARASDASLAQRADHLRQENIALLGALEAAQSAQASQLQIRAVESAAAASKSPYQVKEDEIAALRDAISGVGAEMIRLTQALHLDADDLPLAEKLRQLQSRAPRGDLSGGKS